MGTDNETALEAGIRNLEERFTRWIRLFENEHKAVVLSVELIHDADKNINKVNMLVRPRNHN
jgi:RNA processing factor Prp31